MVIRQQSFNGQTDGGAITTTSSATSGDVFSSVYLPGTATLKYSATQRAHGDRSMQFAGSTPTGQSGRVSWESLNFDTVFSYRIYLYLTGYPSATMTVAQAGTATSFSRNILNVSTTGQLGFADAAGTNYWTTAVASLNAWYRVEGTFTLGTSGSVLFKMFSLDSGTALDTLNPTTIDVGTGATTVIKVGKTNPSPVVNTFYIDDLAVQDTASFFGPLVTGAPSVTGGSVVTGMNVQLSAVATTFDLAAPTYAWTQTAGTAVTLSDPTIANPTYVAPTQGTFSHSVLITDSVGATATASVPVTLTAAVGVPTLLENMYHDVFVIDVSNSAAAAAGALSFAISPSTGLAILAPGIWSGPMPSTPKTYTVTITEAGNPNTATGTVNVPAATASTGGTGIHILVATGNDGSGGAFL